MWWSRALVLVVVLALGPAGCGFRPLYGKRGDGSSAASDMARVRIGNIPDRSGQELRNALLDRVTPLGEPAAPAYLLNVALVESVAGSGYRKDSTASLGRMVVRANFTLTDLAGRSLWSGTADSTTSFNFLGPRYGSVAMERDAEERALQDLADDIRNQLGIYFNRGERRRADDAGAP